VISGSRIHAAAAGQNHPAGADLAGPDDEASSAAQSKPPSPLRNPRGYASTADKRGIPILVAIRDGLVGNAWMPPLPDIA